MSDANDEIVVNATPTTPSTETSGISLSESDAVADARKGATRTVPVRRVHSHEDTAVAVMLTHAQNERVATTDKTGTPLPGSAAGGPTVTMEALLQGAWYVGEGLRPAGYGELELRVRLGDGTEDVLVRLHVASERVLVSFLTNSSTLQRALEHGWKELSSGSGPTASGSVASPVSKSGQQPLDRTCPIKAGPGRTAQLITPPLGCSTAADHSRGFSRWSRPA